MVPPHARRRDARGMTLIEIMMVIAIIGVVSAMAAATAQSIGARNAVQNAASEIGTRLQLARALTEQRGSNVVVMVYPSFQNKGTKSLTTGQGAIFIIEDVNGDWATSTGACDGTGTSDCGQTNFNPVTGKIVLTTSGKDRMIAAIYLEDYPQSAVRFGNATNATGTWPAPFSSFDDTTTTAGCTFCSSNKGTVIFLGDGGLQLLNGSGTAAARTGGLTLVGKTQALNNAYRYGLVSATGLVTLVK